MNVIKIFTIKGCKACEILNNILDSIKDEIKIKIENIDYNNPAYKDFIREHNITDFPTMSFLKDDKVIALFDGTFDKESILSMVNRFYCELPNFLQCPTH